MKRLILILVGMMTGTAWAEPAVTITGVVQNDDESVVVTYDLANENAVITMKAFDHGEDIGDVALWYVEGEVNKEVEVGTSKTIRWRPDVSWPGHSYSETSVQFQLSAWPTNDTPDYLVLDLRTSMPAESRIRYYTSTNALPGGLLANYDYRISKMVFRKIEAKGVAWKMGPDGGQHDVVLDHNYYIGVFEFTEGQWHTLKGGNAGYFAGVEYKMRAVDTRNLIAVARGTGESYRYPNAPDPTLPLGLMRGMCPDKYDFDLPGEAEWEFAARAGNTNGYWNDGTKVLSTTDVDTNLSRLARYKKNGGFIGGTTNPYSSCNYTIGPTNGVAIVGTYAPSAWGLYDIHGNCGEYCLDAWQADITELGGVIVPPTTDGSLAFRGGRYQDDPSTCMLGTRAGTTGYSSAGGGYGMRVAVHAGLK